MMRCVCIVLADNALRTSLSAHGASGALQSAAQTRFDALWQHTAAALDRSLTRRWRKLSCWRHGTRPLMRYSTALSATATLALATGALGQAPP